MLKKTMSVYGMNTPRGIAMADVIKSFLVGLSYKVDEASKKKFEGSAEKAEKNISALGKTMTVTAIAFVAGVTKIASELERMQFMSRRVGASSANIKSFQYAISQMGGTAAEAAGSLESLAQKLRSSPGYYGLLNRLGVQTKAANGGLRDTVDIVSDLSKSLRSMPYYKASAYANVLGIDERTLLAIQDGSLSAQMDKYKEMRKSVGLGSASDPNGRGIMQELRESTTLVMLIIEKFNSSLAELLLPTMKMINRETARLVKWFNNLSPETKQMIKVVSTATVALVGLASVIGAVSTALKVLKIGLGFISLGSPLIAGIAALGAAIALLWDDYQVWKEGGKSFIDWDKWGPDIEKAVKWLKELDAVLVRVQDKYFKDNGSIKDVQKRSAQMGQNTLGYVSKLFESGTGGAGTVSSGKGDKGGASYGSYQLSSKTGTLNRFLQSSGYGNQFNGLVPGTAAFNNKWKQLAATDKNFGAAQQNFIKQTHYDPMLANLKKNGIDLSNRGSAVKELVWSTANQHGANSSVIANALKGMDSSKMSDAGIISAVQGYKTKNYKSLFRGSPQNWPGLVNRFAKEEKALLALNAQESAVLGGPSGAASGGGGMNQVNNINITGVSNPNEVAKAVKGSIDNANSRFQRNTSNSYR